MKLLVFARALFPDFKKSTYENRNIFFENTDFFLDDFRKKGVNKEHMEAHRIISKLRK